MAFIKEETRLRKFEVKHFGISHTSDKPLPNHIEAQVFNPGLNKSETKYVEKYPAVEGRVINVEWYQRTDKNDKMYRGYEITMDIDDEVIVLDVPFKQPPAPIYSLLVKHGENVNWSKPLEISAWETRNAQDKPKTGVCFWQKDEQGNRVSVKAAHTKDNPNGCPEPEFDEFEQKFKWGAVERWLKFNFDDNVIPKIKAAAADYVPTPKRSAPTQIFIEAEEEDDAPVVHPQEQARKAAAGANSQRAEPDDPFGDDIGF